MDMSGREVSRLLGLGQSTTTRVLAAGLAGPGHRRGSSLLYDRDTVLALRDRPTVTPETPLPPACHEGVLVARVDPRRAPATGDAPDALGRGPWRLAVGRGAVLSVLLSRAPVPLVVTVAGSVVRDLRRGAGADAAGRAAAVLAVPAVPVDLAAPGRHHRRARRVAGVRVRRARPRAAAG